MRSSYWCESCVYCCLHKSGSVLYRLSCLQVRGQLGVTLGITRPASHAGGRYLWAYHVGSGALSLGDAAEVADTVCFCSHIPTVRGSRTNERTGCPGSRLPRQAVRRCRQCVCPRVLQAPDHERTEPLVRGLKTWAGMARAMEGGSALP
eukprot:COSAG01_NODE_1088_length_11788_cov_12.741124_9_plen_149_part_00